MPKQEMDNLAKELGRLTGVMEGVIKSNDSNTAEIKHFNQFMYEAKGAQTERDKHYKRVKHTAVGSAIVSLGALIKVVLGHA